MKVKRINKKDNYHEIFTQKAAIFFKMYKSYNIVLKFDWKRIYEAIYYSLYGEDEWEIYFKLGPYILENGAIYIGEWLNGVRHGLGEQYRENGSYYIGNWENDKVKLQIIEINF